MNTQTEQPVESQNKAKNGVIEGVNDFYWDNNREPHLKRREEILKAHPEVTKLFGIDPMLKFTTIFLVLAQMATAYFINYTDSIIIFLLAAYFIGATITHALFLAIHEITHDLAFRTKVYNNMLAIFANIPLIAPYAMSFKVYHAIHHWEQGKDGEDTDIPTEAEAKLFRGFFGKTIWFIHQILFYAFRPIFVKRIKIEKWNVYNIIFQITVIAAIVWFVIGFYGLLYLGVSMLLAGGLHPTSGHFISEHYVMHKGQETYSYYGPLNLLTFNVGYHNEHHDFPRVPGSRLPELKKMAPEFYDNLHSYKSWTGVIFKFLFRKDVTLYSRTKRKVSSSKYQD